MIKYEEIKKIHLELTERCQAECPMCPRTGNLLVGKRELSLSDIEFIFPEEFVKQLDSIMICGNFGEPVIAKDFIDIIKYFRFANENIFLKINSNAGARDKDFWKKLAYLLQDKGVVFFGIDGLEDTNHIYRKNVQWDKVMQSAKTFINAGGKAHWDFLVFEHNEHQVDEAKKLAKEMGFDSFELKFSSRWTGYNEDDLKPTKLYSNEALNTINSIQDMEKFYDSCSIKCSAAINKKIYVSAEGLVTPCCWTAGSLYDRNKSLEMRSIIDNKNDINARFKSIKEILEEKHLEKYAQSWIKPSIKEGKLKVCSMHCNDKFNLIHGQNVDVTNSESNVT